MLSPDLGGERLAREDDGRWTLSDRPIHAGDVLAARLGGAWRWARFEWTHRGGAVLPTLYTDEDDPRTYAPRDFQALALRWP